MTEIVKVFTKMFTFIHIYEVLISGDIDCDDVVILAEAMKDKSAIARNLVVHLDKSCMRALVDIKIYSRDRAELTCVHYHGKFYACTGMDKSTLCRKCISFQIVQNPNLSPF